MKKRVTTFFFPFPFLPVSSIGLPEDVHASGAVKLSRKIQRFSCSGTALCPSRAVKLARKIQYFSSAVLFA